MSPKPSESNLRGELRVSEATERGEDLGGGVPLPGPGEFCILSPKKTVSDAYILSKDYYRALSMTFQIHSSQ